MGHSENLDQLAVGLVEFQKKLKQPKRDSTAKIPLKSGGEYSYKYSSLDQVWEAAMEEGLLGGCGLCIMQTYRFALNGGEVVDTLETMLLHISGQYKTGEQVLRSKQLDSQGMGSATTYARRYGTCAILGIVPAEDDDGSHASQQQRENREPDAPPCPNCGKPLRRDKANAKKLYCWKNEKLGKDGCGYDSTQDDGVDHETGEVLGKPQGQSSTPASSVSPASSSKAPVTTAAKDELDLGEWAKLVELAEACGWPQIFVQNQYDKVRKTGASTTVALANCRAKYGVPNTKAVKDDELKAEAEKAGF
jgi:hypothetical protein